MLFAQSIEPKDTLTWILLALAVVALGGLITKVIATYRSAKQRQEQMDAARREQQIADTLRLLEIKGEYLEMQQGIEYSVGNEGQIKEGRYVLKSANENGKLTVRLNGQIREFYDGEVVTLTDGDVICPTDAVLIKPHTYIQEKNNGTLL